MVIDYYGDEILTYPEQPIFTTKAHVFQIDPETKKKWIPISSQATSVAYYHDSTRNTYRIVSVEENKVLINCNIVSNMTFTKTSQKFGQWTDPRANTVYGLGFASEADLNKFIDKFKEVKESTRQAPSSTTNGNGDSMIPSPLSSPRTNLARESPRFNTIPDSPRDSPGLTMNQNGSPDVEMYRSLSQTAPSTTTGGSQLDKLKYENERLKMALAQSSANAKQWDVELQTLKTNNSRLTAALQESAANVEEWKKQLTVLKEENVALKKKMSSAKSEAAYERQISELQDRIRDLDFTKEQKSQEAQELYRKLESLRLSESQTQQKLQDKIQGLERDNDALRRQVSDLQKQSDNRRSIQMQARRIHDEMTRKLNEIVDLNSRSADFFQ